MYHNPICNGLTILLYYRWLQFAGYQPQRYNFYPYLRKIENVFYLRASEITTSNLVNATKTIKFYELYIIKIDSKWFLLCIVNKKGVSLRHNSTKSLINKRYYLKPFTNWKPTNHTDGQMSICFSLFLARWCRRVFRCLVCIAQQHIETNGQKRSH